MDIELDGQVLEAHTALHSLQRGARRPRGGELQVAVGKVAGRTANAGATNMGATANTIHPTLHRDRTADPRPIYDLVDLCRQIVCTGRERMGQRVIQPTRAPLLVKLQRHHLGQMEAYADDCLNESFARRRTAGHVDDRQASTAEKVTAQVGFQPHSPRWTTHRSRNATPGGATAYRQHCLGVWSETVAPRRGSQ